MKRLKELIDRLKGFEDIMIETIERVIRENEDLITEMNSEDQLFEQGIDRHGSKIANYAPYSPVTIQYKRAKRQPTARVTLRDEGDFHASFYIEFTNEGFEIKASDWKTDHLIKGYGEGILGLSNENFRDLAENYVGPELADLFRKL